MQLSQIMTPNPETLAPDASLTDAAKEMDRLNIGAIPICDGERLQGLITDRDIVVRAVAAGKDPSSCTVSEAMTDEVFFCFDDNDVTDAEQVMQARQIRRLPIVNRDKKLVGIVSLGDIATDREEGVEQTLEEISTPSRPER